MAEGVEIVIKPIHLERLAYSLVIITLVVLLIIKWNSGGVAEENSTAGVIAEMELNNTNQSINNTPQDLCSNGVKDQDETDVDCGGSICEPCDEFKSCNVDSDCESGYCHMGIKCREPTCDDGVKNQDESNIDCGGVCGGFWYDGACHDEPKPRYSGRVDLSILEVSTTENEASGYAKIQSVKFKVENGKEEDMILTAYIFARDEHGSPYFERSASNEEVAMAEVGLPLLGQGESHTETVEIMRTLPETDPSEAYSVVVELRDDNDELVRRATWTNE